MTKTSAEDAIENSGPAAPSPSFPENRNARKNLKSSNKNDKKKSTATAGAPLSVKIGAIGTVYPAKTNAYAAAGRKRKNSPITDTSPAGKTEGQQVNTDTVEIIISSTARKKRKRSPKLFETALLSNAERNELHIEIYKYFHWLQKEVAELETSELGQRSSRRAGVVFDGIQTLLVNMESTFKIIQQEKDAEDTDGLSKDTVEEGPDCRFPFLERSLRADFIHRVEVKETKKETKKESEPIKPKGDTRDFDALFEDMMIYKQEHGHPNVPYGYKQDIPLARWVYNLRGKRKGLQEKGEECQVADEVKEKAWTTHLTQERIDRLDSVGFSWTALRKQAPWEERFQELLDYYQAHGNCRVPEKVGPLGRWVEQQRYDYRKKNMNFMKNRAPILDEIGFEWNPRGFDLGSWDERIEELVSCRKSCLCILEVMHKFISN